jgi:hypothetical protein
MKMKRALLLSFAVLTLCTVFGGTPARAETPDAHPAMAAMPTMPPAFLSSTPVEPAWSPALLMTPQSVGSLDPVVGAQGLACAPMCYLCSPCLKMNCHREGNCIRCC